VAHLKNSFFVFKILKNIGVHLYSELKSLIEDRCQGIEEDSTSMVAAWKSSLKLLIFVEDRA
jgi:hypothetical protein